MPRRKTIVTAKLEDTGCPILKLDTYKNTRTTTGTYNSIACDSDGKNTYACFGPSWNGLVPDHLIGVPVKLIPVQKEKHGNPTT